VHSNFTILLRKLTHVTHNTFRNIIMYNGGRWQTATNFTIGSISQVLKRMIHRFEIWTKVAEPWIGNIIMQYLWQPILFQMTVLWPKLIGFSIWLYQFTVLIRYYVALVAFCNVTQSMVPIKSHKIDFSLTPYTFIKVDTPLSNSSINIEYNC
jgi:hypothetical protein